MTTAKFKIVPCADPELLRLSKTQLTELGAKGGKKGAAALVEIERRKNNRAAKNAALKAAGLR